MKRVRSAPARWIKEREHIMEHMGKKVTVFGSFVVDLMGRTPHLPAAGETVKGTVFKMGPGGKGFNQGVAAHKAGADVTMVTKLGRDAFADIALNTMNELHMDTGRVLYSETTETGCALIMVDENSSQNEIIIPFVTFEATFLYFSCFGHKGNNLLRHSLTTASSNLC